jgi:hypothetical protein
LRSASLADAVRELTQADYLANTGLVHKIAGPCYRRALATGIAIDYDDVVGELTLAFVKSWQKFDESKGLKFSTYFTVAAHHQFNRFIEKQVAERMEHGVRSIEEINSWGSAGNTDGTLTMEDVLPCAALTPEQRVSAQQQMEVLGRRLTPLTKLVLEWLLNPPPELSREVEAAVQHAVYSRAQGYNARVADNDVSVRAILKFIAMVKPGEITKDQIAETKEELTWLLARAGES